MANRNYPHKHGSEPKNMGQYYMVDTTELFNLGLYKGVNQRPEKPERKMIIKLLIAFWYGVGLPCWLISLLAGVLGWIHFTPNSITVIVGAILGLSKAAILWAEKGEVFFNKCKRIYDRYKRNHYFKRKRIKP